MTFETCWEKEKILVNSIFSLSNKEQSNYLSLQMFSIWTRLHYCKYVKSTLFTKQFCQHRFRKYTADTIQEFATFESDPDFRAGLWNILSQAMKPLAAHPLIKVRFEKKKI